MRQPPAEEIQAGHSNSLFASGDFVSLVMLPAVTLRKTVHASGPNCCPASVAVNPFASPPRSDSVVVCLSPKPC